MIKKILISILSVSLVINSTTASVGASELLRHQENSFENRSMALKELGVSGGGAINIYRTGPDLNSIKAPYSNSDGVTTWDCVWFGNYWQEDTNGDQIADEKDNKQPIKWRVLSKNGNGLFLISDKTLDCKPYNEKEDAAVWENCTLRSWLNGLDETNNVDGTGYETNSFYDEAFNSTEKSLIKKVEVDNSRSQQCYDTNSGNDTYDKVYILSYGEIKKSEYGFVDDTDIADPARVALLTSYTENKGAWTRTSTKPSYWWLRSPGKYGIGDAFHMTLDGNVDFRTFANGGINWVNCAVRPVINVSISSSSMKYAGTVCSDGTVNEENESENDSGEDEEGNDNNDNIIIKTYSDRANGSLSVGETAVFIPRAYKNDQVISGENDWKFTIEKGNYVAEIIKTEVIDGDIGVEIKANYEGSTKLSVLHVPTGKEMIYPLTVSNTNRIYDISHFTRGENAVKHAGILLDDFESKEANEGYNLTFHAYNGVQTIGAVEVYDSSGNIINIKKIDKFEAYQDDIKEVVKDGSNLIVSFFNGTINSYKNSMYSKDTEISVFVPEGGYIIVSNDIKASYAGFMYNAVDLTWSVAEQAADWKKDISEENKKMIAGKTEDDIGSTITQYIIEKKIEKNLFDRYMEKLEKSTAKKVSKEIVADFCSSFLYSSDELLNDIDIDLEEQYVKSAEKLGLGLGMDAFYELGGPAGTALKNIFKVDKALNTLMQFYDTYRTCEEGFVKITFEDNYAKEMNYGIEANYTNGGTPISNASLVVVDITDYSGSQYIIKDIGNGSNIIIWDISLYRESSIVQPNQPISIKIPVPSGFEGNTCKIYRCEEDGSYTDMNASFTGDYLTFSTDHLSLYALIGDTKLYTINALSGTGGSISPSGTIKVKKGDNQSFVIQANEGYRIKNVLVDTENIGSVKEYSFNDITEDHNIEAVFEKDGENSESTDNVDNVLKAVETQYKISVNVKDILLPYYTKLYPDVVVKKTKFKSSDKKIVKVNKKGIAKGGKNSGSATITMFVKTEETVTKPNGKQKKKLSKWTSACTLDVNNTGKQGK